MKILITGVAGFIGHAAALRFLERGDNVVGLDNLNSYYDVTLKNDRLSRLLKFKNFEFIKSDIFNTDHITYLFESTKPEKVLHLAAQAGVRYSVENPMAYVDSNLKGFMNILESCRRLNVSHLVYASSSSVYGSNTKYPFSEADGVDHPVSIYAATKKANELMAHAYSELFQIPTTGLRFFTVYGPWGRPDMSPFLFSKSILSAENIKIFNYGKMKRDFTYIDDVVECIHRVVDKPATKSTESALLGNLNPSISATAPYRIFNVGNSTPHTLMEYITLLENVWGMEAKKTYLPMQDGDVESTEASTIQLEDWINFCPNTDLKMGLSNFVSWYRDYYRV